MHDSTKIRKPNSRKKYFTYGLICKVLDYSEKLSANNPAKPHLFGHQW